MIKSALTCMDISIVKLNSLKHSTEMKHFAKNTHHSPPRMTKTDFQVNVLDVNRSLEMDIEKTMNPPEHLAFVTQTKRRRRRDSKKIPVVVQNGGLVQELTEADRLTSDGLAGLVSTLSLCSERSGGAVAASTALGYATTTDKANGEAGMSCASFPRLPFVSPRKKLIILDINGLLADIVSPPPKERKADTRIARRAVFRRPACRDFLKFCFERFEVGIWSSRSEKIASRVIDYLMGGMKRKLLFCWDLSHCTKTGFKTLENRHKTLVFKELRRVWEKHDPNLPWQKGEYNETNTLLLDDSPYKALLNPACTAVFPHSYKFYDTRGDNSLAADGDLRVYLQELSAASDVQKFVEQNPFGQRPITESSSSWDFYFKVISTMYSLPSSM